jgi:glycosyltransferase involved in cell wall biosynthesis
VAGILDDGYHLIKKNNAAYQFWGLAQANAKNNETGEEVILNLVPPPLQQLRWGIRMLKGLIVPSKALAEDWSLYTKTYRIHNHLDEERYKGEEKLFPHEDTLWIAWSGSLSHFESFEDSGLFLALADTIKRFKNVRILISGDKRVYDKIPVAEGKKIFSSFVPENQYASLLRSCEIGLAPLCGTYDLRRSWLKFLDYGICKVPVIASDLQPYEELRDYGLMTQNTYQSWKSALARMIKNYPEYKQKAETTSYEFAISQTFDRNVDKLLAVYQQIIDDHYPDEEQIWHPNAIH